MKVKYADAADAAGEDVLRWFELCETPGECAELANDMKGLIDSVAATRAEWLSRPDAPRPDPMRVGPTEDALGLDAAPFRVGRDQQTRSTRSTAHGAVAWTCSEPLAGKRLDGRSSLSGIFQDASRPRSRRRCMSWTRRLRTALTCAVA